MKNDSREIIRKLARFLSTPDDDYEKMVLENDGEIIEKIIGNIKENKKREDNEWMTHFSDDQIKRLDEKMDMKLTGTSLQDYWTYE